MTDMTIEGDWYLQLGEQPLAAATLPRYTLRAGRIFQSDRAEPIGSYTVDANTAKLAISETDLVTFVLPGLSDHALSGTLTSAAGEDDIFSEPALLLRATEDTPAH